MTLKLLSLFVMCCASLTLFGSETDAAYAPSRSREGQLLDVMIPRILVEEFSYVPTREGYRYSYKLPDGTAREEVGFIVNPDSPDADMLVMGAFSQPDSDGNSVTTTMFTSDRDGFRSRMNTKNRKLSPKSLQSLAG